MIAFDAATRSVCSAVSVPFQPKRPDWNDPR